MSRDPYGYGGRGGDRWDAERFEFERDRNRFGTETRERYEERDTRFSPRGGGYGPPRPRDRSIEDFDRRGPRGFEDRGPRFEEDRYERKVYYDDEPRYERERPIGRERGHSTNITIEKEREYYSPSPPRRAPAGRPAFLRRQSSLDTFDRKPLTRFSDREEYGPPARYRPDARPPPLTPIPLPRTRQLDAPPRRFVERDYEEIRVAEPDFYGDDEYRGYPERVREREIIRRRRRSRSRESRASHSVRSSSSSSRGTSISEATTRSEFPKKGKTRMPSRLVSKQAIIDLGYPFEEEGDVIIIQKALGRENIDEVIKLSEDYKASEKPEMSGARSDAGTVVFEEHKKEEIITVPSVPHPPQGGNLEVITDTKIVERRSPSPHHHHHHANPIIVDAVAPISDPIAVGPLALVPSARKDERAIRAEIKALEAEQDALRAERRAEREFRKADRIRRGARGSEGDLVLYEHDHYERPVEEVTLVRKEYITEPDGGVKILKDKKGPPPKLLRAMLKTLT